MKPFDETFADKVREVFDHHEEPYDPQAWEALQARLSKKRQTRFISMLPLWAKIAASLLIITTLTWLSLMVSPPDSTYLSEAETSSPAVSAAADTDLLLPRGESIANGVIEEQDTMMYDTQPPRTTPAKPVPASHYAGTIQPSGHTAVIANEADSIHQRSHPKTGDTAGLTYYEAGADSLERFPVEPATARLVAGDPPGQLLTGTPALPVAHPPQGTPANGITLTAEQDGLSRKNDEKKITWGVAASSILAYAGEDAGSGIGFSGGLTSEYRLTESVRVTSGLFLAYQQFGSETVPARKQTTRDEMFSGHDAVRISAERDYELLVMDIPLNIQLRLPASKNRQWQLTTGLSSLLYLQQKMSGKETIVMETSYYDQLSSMYRTQSFLTEVEVSSSYEPFSRFDFARLLNLSIGYAITQKKTTTVIEPFVKLPLGAISSRELKMGMGGLSLRLHFGH